MADALEQPLLLPQDMVDLRTLKKHEVFLIKVSFSFFFKSILLFFLSLSYFGLPYVFISFQVIQTTNVTKEWVDHAYSKLKDKEACRVSIVKALAIAEKKIEDLGPKLTEANRERRSVEAALASVEKQAEDQRQHRR